MASAQDLSSGAHAQLNRKEHAANQPPNPSLQSSGPQDQSYAAQATNFLQQTGEQVKNMAQGAAEAVKNTLGMNTENESTHGQARSHPPSSGSPANSNNPTRHPPSADVNNPTAGLASTYHNPSHPPPSAAGLGSANNPSHSIQQPTSAGRASTNNPTPSIHQPAGTNPGSNPSHSI